MPNLAYAVRHEIQRVIVCRNVGGEPELVTSDKEGGILVGVFAKFCLRSECGRKIEFGFGKLVEKVIPESKISGIVSVEFLGYHFPDGCHLVQDGVDVQDAAQEIPVFGLVYLRLQSVNADCLVGPSQFVANHLGGQCLKLAAVIMLKVTGY